MATPEPVRQAWAALQMLSAAACLGLAGCANEAALQPPSLHLPAPVQRLSAVREGNTVLLNWTNPARTTDGVSLTTGRIASGPFSAEICRSVAVLPPGPCAGAVSLATEPGKPSTYQDALPLPFTEGAPRAIYYRVRILNGRKRGATGTSVLAAAGLAPPPIALLQAQPDPNGGVLLQWQPSPVQSRVLLHVRRGNARAQTLAVEATGSDPGGATDAAAQASEEQRYTATRVQTFLTGGQSLTLTSAPASVTVPAGAAPPPPAAPGGLDAVVNTLGAPEVDLVWQVALGAGAEAFVVERAERNDTWRRLTATPVRGFSFADTSVRPGVRYRYRIAAVGRSGIVGPFSKEIERTVPER